MFKKLLLLLILGLSHSLLPVKIQTGSNNTNHECIADGGEFELSATELNQLNSTLIDGIIEDTGIIGRDTIPLPINKLTFALLKNILSDTPVFNAERAQSILHDSTVTEFLPLLYALAFLNTTNEVLLQTVARHYLAIQKNIGFDNFAQHVRYIAAFFQPNCVKTLLAQAATPYTCLQTFIGHTKWVMSVAFSPDSTKLVTGSNDNTAKLWNVYTGECVHTFTGHTNKIISVAFSSDGTKLATGSLDNTARLWDVGTGQCLQILNGHTGLIRSIAFSPDDTNLATAFDDGTARLWAILDTSQQVLLVWSMKNTEKFTIGVLPFLDEVYASLPEQLQQKIMTATGI